MILSATTKKKKNVIYKASLEVFHDIEHEKVIYNINYLIIDTFKKASFTSFKKACEFYKKVCKIINKI